MTDLQADLSDLLHRCRVSLLSAEPTVVSYSDLNDLRENRLPDSLGASLINLYAIWSREVGSAWVLQYIGQRSSKFGWSRVRQHLFHTPGGTQSKISLVREALASGQEIGVTGILVEPDFLRLSLEDELIRQVTRQSGALPWNRRSRFKGRSNGP
jgi:hypothetical protein